MLPLYLLIVDIAAPENTPDSIDQEKFCSQIAPCQSYLEALKGVVGRGSCIVKYFPPGAQNGKHGWSAQYLVTSSLGAKRSEYLIQLFEAIVRLIDFELPDFDVSADVKMMRFS